MWHQFLYNLMPTIFLSQFVSMRSSLYAILFVSITIKHSVDIMFLAELQTVGDSGKLHGVVTIPKENLFTFGTFYPCISCSRHSAMRQFY